MCGGVFEQLALATRRGTRNPIYILAFIPLNLLTTSAYPSTSPTLSYSTFPNKLTSSIVAVFIAKAGHVWVS